MRRDRLKNAVALCAAGLIAAAVPTSASASAPASVPSAGTRAAAPSAPNRTVAVDCFSQARVRPGEFLLACGDGNNRLVSLRWTRWGPESAVGSGLDAVNDCRPYCAAGTFHTYPVTVRLDRPRSWQKHPELRQFTRLQLVYTDGTPAHADRVTHYALWN
ncbi:hypothetical protein [Streptomyces sp. NPDC056061]|uniref:hypothetical protein n=1 Tax=Streptomyces sp. NPDC056061 TaxID=3345700 RepID=UPI0035DF4402